MIEERLSKNRDYNERDIAESLFNFWEFVEDEYAGNLMTLSHDTGISLQVLTTMDHEYRENGIICLQERDAILEMIKIIKQTI